MRRERTVISLITINIEILLSIVICILLVLSLRPFLWRELVDVCLTEKPAQFGIGYSSTLMVGLPLIISMGFRSRDNTFLESVFEIIRSLSGVLVSFFFSLILVPIGAGIFTMTATRWTKEAAK